MTSNRTFREPKIADEESGILENDVPKSTSSVNKGRMKILGRGRREEQLRKPCEEENGSAGETSQIQDLETNIYDRNVSKIFCSVTVRSIFRNSLCTVP